MGRVRVAGGELAARAAFVEVRADLAPRAVERLGRYVVEDGAVPSRGGRVGDAAAHEPGPDDGDGLDPHVVLRRSVVGW